MFSPLLGRPPFCGRRTRPTNDSMRSMKLCPPAGSLNTLLRRCAIPRVGASACAKNFLATAIFFSCGERDFQFLPTWSPPGGQAGPIFNFQIARVPKGAPRGARSGPLNSLLPYLRFPFDPFGRLRASPSTGSGTASSSGPTTAPQQQSQAAKRQPAFGGFPRQLRFRLNKTGRAPPINKTIVAGSGRILTAMPLKSPPPQKDPYGNLGRVGFVVGAGAILETRNPTM